MSDLKQRIADILWGKRCYPATAPDLQVKWCEDVAEVLVSELGLTREWIVRPRPDGKFAYRPTPTDRQPLPASVFPGESVETRYVTEYVTEWVPE